MYRGMLSAVIALAIFFAAVAAANAEADSSKPTTISDASPASAIVELDIAPFDVQSSDDPADSMNPDRPFVAREASQAFRAQSAAQLQSQVTVPLPATSGAALALLASYGWGISCRRWRRRHVTSE